MNDLNEHPKVSRRGGRSRFSMDHEYWVSTVPEESTHGPFLDGFRVWVISMETARRTQKIEDLSIDRAPKIVPNADAALPTTDLGINVVCRMLEEMHADSTMQEIGWMHCEPEHEPPEAARLPQGTWMTSPLLKRDIFYRSEQGFSNMDSQTVDWPMHWPDLVERKRFSLFSTGSVAPRQRVKENPF